MLRALAGGSDSPSGSMSSGSPPFRGRATRFALRFPVYFRELRTSTWRKGKTVNISHTGMLIRSHTDFSPETTLEMRVPLAVGRVVALPAEIRCKGTVVRVEKVPAAEPSLAVAIRDYRIVRQRSAAGHLPGQA